MSRTQDMSKALRQLAANPKYVDLQDTIREAVNRWERNTPLLEGLSEKKKGTIALLLENQLRHTINETNTIGLGGNQLTPSGNIQGYITVAFPMVRKIFGNTVANNIASIQTMNSQQGLIYYLDFVVTRNVGGDTDVDGNPASEGEEGAADYSVATYAKGRSLFGEPAGREIRRGASRVGGQYDLSGSGYSKWHEKEVLGASNVVFAGAYNSAGVLVEGTPSAPALLDTEGRNAEALQYDSDILRLIEDGQDMFLMIVENSADGNLLHRFDLTNQREFGLFHVANTAGVRETSGALPILEADGIQASKGLINVRRLTAVGRVVRDGSGDVVGFRRDPFVRSNDPEAALMFVVKGAPVDDATTPTAVGAAAFATSTAVGAPSILGFSAPIAGVLDIDARTGATTLIPEGESNLAVDPRPLISEITLTLGTEEVTARKRAYRVKWTDDLATDVRAQLAINVSEVLSNTMSDAIQLDIDRELLADMLDKASAARFYWSKQVGKYVDRRNGRRITADFSDATSVPLVATASMARDEWYMGLVEAINGVANEIQARTLRGQANFIVVSPDVANIIESMRKFTPTFSMDANGQIDFGSYTLGAQQIGVVDSRYMVYRCVDFPKNQILVGYKGQDDVDCGYIYAPYVPLMITPQLANTEDFQPRQAIFTRYAKKMVRADYFGTVTVQDIDSL